MKVLLTGGSGHLGANLVRRLLADGLDVRCLQLPGANNAGLDGLPVERVDGDLRDPAAMRRAVAGVERIYHTAAKISTLEGGEQELFDINVLGTRNLLTAAREAGVGRVVVTGSFSACGHFADRPSTERDPFNMFDHVMPYEKSKAGVEHECLKAVVEGQDVVVATSCAILGPHDYVPSRMGRTLIDFAHGKLAAYIPGGFEFVAARDIVEGHVLAMKKGRTGQKYILSSGFVAIDDLMDIFQRVTGHAKPKLRLPPPVMAAISEVTHFVLTNFFPKVPQRLTPGAVRILRQCRKADITKAKTELGYQPTSIEVAVQDAFDHFIERGLVHGRTAETRRFIDVAPPARPNGKSKKAKELGASA
jgi:nucleoside-diphosphate-sugar epimerase